MTAIEEFVASVADFDHLTSEQQNELLLFFLTSVCGNESATATQIDGLRE